MRPLPSTDAAPCSALFLSPTAPDLTVLCRELVWRYARWWSGTARARPSAPAALDRGVPAIWGDRPYQSSSPHNNVASRVSWHRPSSPTHHSRTPLYSTPLLDGTGRNDSANRHKHMVGGRQSFLADSAGLEHGYGSLGKSQGVPVSLRFFARSDQTRFFFKKKKPKKCAGVPAALK